jgi:hypothetical protein
MKKNVLTLLGLLFSVYTIAQNSKINEHYINKINQVIESPDEVLSMFDKNSLKPQIYFKTLDNQFLVFHDNDFNAKLSNGDLFQIIDLKDFQSQYYAPWLLFNNNKFELYSSSVSAVEIISENKNNINKPYSKIELSDKIRPHYVSDSTYMFKH